MAGPRTIVGCSGHLAPLDPQLRSQPDVRERPYAFLRFGSRWINLAMVSDIEDRGETMVIYLVAEAARMAGRVNPTPVDVARQVTLTRADEVAKLRKWLKLNDEE